MSPPKTSIKSPKKRAKSKKPDIQRLKTVTGKMLDQLEKTLSCRVLKSPKQAEHREKMHEWVFGNKSSLAVTLISLAELILRLEDAEKQTALNSEAGSSAPTRSLAEADIALIEAFVQRARDQATPIPAPSTIP